MLVLFVGASIGTQALIGALTPKHAPAVAAASYAHTSAGMGYTAEFTGKPTVTPSEQTVGDTVLKTELVEYFRNPVDEVVVATELPTELVADDRDELLTTFYDSAASGFPGAKVSAAKTTEVAGEKALSGTITLKNGTVANFVVVYHNEVQYMLYEQVGAKSTQKLFDSFEFAE